MQLNLREIYGSGHAVHLSGSIDMVDFVQSHTNLKHASPAKAEVQAAAELDTVTVNGHVDCDLELICSRCLTEFHSSLGFDFEELFTNKAQSEVDMEEDEENFVNVVTEDRIDLVPYIEEHILLELPQFPICDNHCKGLCPSCGCNRNTETCQCNLESTDPRWNGLKDLFQQ